MDTYTENNFSGKALDHLGLVADKIEDLNLINAIDEKLPLSNTSGVKVTMGQRVAAMILNGLGFVDTRLYMFPEFLAQKPVKRLFNNDKLKANWFNDDALGRCLDSIAEYGTTKLFTELSFSIGIKKKLLGRGTHFDTSTLQVYGEYNDTNDLKNTETEESPPQPARGYSKSHRHDLKQMVINLATTGKANFPIWMESHSGNASDKTILPTAASKMNSFCDSLKDVPDFIYVGDSAMYSNILQYSDTMKWLSRVPENILEARNLISTDIASLDFKKLDDGYSYYAYQSEYKDVSQRWILIFSEQAYKREVKTLQKNIAKELLMLNKTWKVIGKELFACEKDANKAIKVNSRLAKYHNLNATISKVMGYSGSGRPSKNTDKELKGYKIEFTIDPDENAIKISTSKKGKFILSTNELDIEKLPDNEVLQEYKAQAGTESGFKFIKSNTFEIDSIFLKKASRIDALMMIMTLCLMVYGVSQYDLRESLQQNQDTIPDQKRNPTNKPSMKWVYFLFSGVHELTIYTADKLQHLVINVDILLKQIIGYFGDRAKSIYLNPS